MKKRFEVPKDFMTLTVPEDFMTLTQGNKNKGPVYVRKSDVSTITPHSEALGFPAGINANTSLTVGGSGYTIYVVETADVVFDLLGK